MSSIAERIKIQRKRKPMTQAYFADRLNVDRRTVINWENGITEPSGEMIINIANVLGISPDLILTGETSNRKVPVYDSISAGIPLEAIENIYDYEEIPEHWTIHHEYFALKVKGDSMAPRMYDNDVVIVRKQDDVENGEIAIVLVNGTDATIKKILKSPDGITLQPLNFNYTPKFYSNREIEELPVKILGRVVELRAKY